MKDKVIVNGGRLGTHEGISFQGCVTATRSKLLKVLGKAGYENTSPARHGKIQEKIRTEWTLEFPDGTIATVYDWKLSCQPSLTEEYEWHIGGTTNSVNSLVNGLVKGGDNYDVENLAIR